MADNRKPLGYYEAVVRVPLYGDDQVGPDGPGNWWQYHEPRITAAGGTLVTQRPVTEISHRLLDENGNEVVNWPPVRHDKNG
jgi:hypothetical protein